MTKTENNQIEYFEEENYLVRNFYGTFNATEILESWEFIIVEKIKGNNYVGIINDFSDVKLNLEVKDLNPILNLLKKNKDLLEHLKIAVIIKTPYNIVFPILARKNTSLNIKAFSTIEAAKKWMIK